MSILSPSRRPLSRYHPRVRDETELPPRWRPPAMWERHAPDMPMSRFVVLSILLHALFIMLFGAPTGGSREGRAMWGSSSLDVVIRDPFRAQEPAPALRFEPSLGSLKPSPAAVAPSATTSNLQPAPAPEPPRVAAPEEPSSKPVPRVLDRVEPRPEPTFEVPKASERVEAPRVDRELAEPPKIDAPPPPPAPIEVPRIELPVAPRIDRQLAEPPKIEAPPPPPRPIEVPRIEAPAVPRIDRQLAEPPRIDVPAPAPRPIEVPRLESPVVPRVERQMAEPPKLEAPLVVPRIETPPLPAPRVEPLPAPRIESPVAAPAPAVPATPAAPAVPTPRETQAAPRTPPAAERTPATPERTPAVPERTPAVPDLRDTGPRIGRDAAPADVPAPSPFRTPPARAPSTDYDPTAPSLDTDALRKRASELTRAGTGNRAALPFPMPPVEKPKTKMEDAIEKARKPDCRTAYQSLGLAAVVPLIANQFGEGTCRW